MKQPKLGQKIVSLRKEKGLTQEELIEKCNVSIRTIQRIEAGEVTPRSYTLKAIFEALEYDFQEAQKKEEKFLESCNIKTNWFQEPKSWMLFGWIFLMTLVVSLLQTVPKSLSTVDFYFFLAMLLGIQLILVGNKYSTERMKKVDSENATITIGFNSAKVLGYIVFHLSIEFYFIYIIFWYQIYADTSLLLSIAMVLVLLLPTYFILILIYPYINKFLGEKVGLEISDEGLLDNSMFITNTIISWGEIERVEVATSMFGYKWIVPILKNPETYIDQQTNHFKRVITKSNYKKYGSPLRLYTTTLTISPSQLYKILCLRMRNNYD